MKCPHCGKSSPFNASINVEHDGQLMSLRDLAKALGMPASTVHHRYAAGDRDHMLKRPIEHWRRGKRAQTSQTVNPR